MEETIEVVESIPDVPDAPSIDLSGIEDKLDTIIDLLNNIEQYSFDLSVYFRVFLIIILLLISWYVAVWVWRTCLRSYLNKYIKFRI